MEDDGRLQKTTCTTEDNLAAKWESKSQKQQKGFRLRQLCIDPILVFSPVSEKVLFSDQ